MLVKVVSLLYDQMLKISAQLMRGEDLKGAHGIKPSNTREMPGFVATLVKNTQQRLYWRYVHILGDGRERSTQAQLLAHNNVSESLC